MKDLYAQFVSEGFPPADALALAQDLAAALRNPTLLSALVSE